MFLMLTGAVLTILGIGLIVSGMGLALGIPLAIAGLGLIGFGTAGKSRGGSSGPPAS